MDLDGGVSSTYHGTITESIQYSGWWMRCCLGQHVSRSLKIIKSLKNNIKSLMKSKMVSQYRNIFLVGFLHCISKTRWMGGSFLMVYRNNAGRLGSDFISVRLETRWLCQKSGFYVLDQYCKLHDYCGYCSFMDI